MNYWLLKSEPNSYSISDLARDKNTEWDGVRNFQARNFLRIAPQQFTGITGVAIISQSHGFGM